MPIMVGNKKTLPLWLFSMLVANLSTLSILGIGYLVLLVTGLIPGNDALIFLLLFFVVYGLSVGLVASLFFRRTGKSELLKDFGVPPGRLMGIFVGGIIGNSIANWIGILIGATAFYFIGRWVGGQISLSIYNLLEQKFDVDFPKIT